LLYQPTCLPACLPAEEERLRLRAQYETRIKTLDERVKAVRAKEKRAVELERMKEKADRACKKLEIDIKAIKQQKVGLGGCMQCGGVGGLAWWVDGEPRWGKMV